MSCCNVNIISSPYVLDVFLTLDLIILYSQTSLYKRKIFFKNGIASTKREKMHKFKRNTVTNLFWTLRKTCLAYIENFALIDKLIHRDTVQKKSAAT